MPDSRTRRTRWVTLAVGAAALGALASVALLERVSPHPHDPAPGAPESSTAAAVGRPSLWVLAIGVSRYVDPALALRYAAADARAIADEFSRQQGGPLYRDVKTKVLVDAQTTRGAILQGVDAFLGEAAPSDVGVLYMAGHGVREETLDTYYFLPSNASAAAPHIEGLDMFEMNRELRRLRRNMQRLVVILDTCHAGAAASAPAALGQDLAAGLAPAEGLYILTAARSGEPSVELSAVGHGAFTHALLDGLRGAAANPDGLITVFGLASHAARVVRELSGDQQHPYLAILGEDLPLAAAPERFARITPPALPALSALATPAPRLERLAIRNFENLRPDPTYDWMQKVLGEDFTTAFASVRQLDVYDEGMMRFLARGTADAVEAAYRSGMDMLVEGTYWVQNDRVSISVHVKQVKPLQRVASAKLEGPLDQLSTLSGQVVVSLLSQLHLSLPADEVARILQPGSTDLAVRKRLFDAERPAPESLPRPMIPPAAPDRQSLQWGRVFSLLDRAAVSYAAGNDDPEASLRAVLEGYRNAFEARDIEAIGRFYFEFSDAQRAALARYLDNASQLRVEFSDLRIALIGDQAAVSFTRRDRFVDRETGEGQQVVVRVTKLFARGANGWQIVPEH
jgi:TolB-like protein/ketosteroid isomerase-like protein